MNVLVACECSGVVREAFRALGHNAWSCDMKPATDKSAFHFHGDAFEALRCSEMRSRGYGEGNYGWNLVIAHPPCTYLSNSGALRLYRGGKLSNGKDWERWLKMEHAARFFRQFFVLQIELGFKLCVENPIQHGHAMEAHACGKPAQTIQPYDFGEDASKRTALWLRGLPLLKATTRREGRRVTLPDGRSVERWANQTDSGQNKLAPSPTRAARRAVTYSGIANAMAEQWGGNILNLSERELWEDKR